ncbi:g2382 [Coccomyxa viridis]|uniref:Superoxide dismutase n=1 Tax=Coccomyxa viridis TaxID=1274662 RepID=A0ABP1FSB8_9CHLO
MTAILTQKHAFLGANVAQKQRSRPLSRGLRAAARAELELKPLPFAHDALEPKISKETLEVHWGKHHRTYVTNLNNQLKDKPLANKNLEEIIVETYNNGSPTPEFNNAGQIFNHDFYWESLSPEKQEPEGELKDAIDRDFGSLDEFKKQFKAAGATQFGSGWAWLTKGKDGKLKVTKTPNAESPLVHGETPLLTMDVWEHAYYIDYQNRRPDYIGEFVENLINWKKVAERYAA